MWQIGALGLMQPWFLLALLTLPVLWQIIRFTPPAPKRLRFPSLRFLKFLRQDNETPRRSPWWLLALRLLIIGLIIVAASQPILNPEQNLLSRDNVIIVIDNDWAMAKNWPQTQRQILQLLDIAARENKTAQLILTAPDPDQTFSWISDPMPAANAAQIIHSTQPKPWSARWQSLAETLAQASLLPNPDVFYFASGLVDSGFDAVINRLNSQGDMRVVIDPAIPLLYLQAEAQTGDTIAVHLRRVPQSAQNMPQARYTLRAMDKKGQILLQQNIDFAAGVNQAKATLSIPNPIKNQISRIVIPEQLHAGTTYLLDERGRQYPLGLITTQAMDTTKPFLDELYYIERAISPFAEIHQGNLAELLRADLAAMIMTDANSPGNAEVPALQQWIEAGGTLIRFAGEDLYKRTDGLLPVRVSQPPRILGGKMAWQTSLNLGPIPEHSPLAGMAVADDILVKQQILADNDPELAQKTWLSLSDGTPLLTAAKRGQGQIILFHIAANDIWSNMILSGMFVETLQRLLWLSRGIAPQSSQTILSLQEFLDAFGRLGPPPLYSQSLTWPELQTKRVSPAFPPGYYGSAHDRQAFNLGDHITPPEAVHDFPSGVDVWPSLNSAEIDLRPYLYLLIAALAFLDTLLRLNLGNLLPSLAGRKSAAVVLAVLVLGLGHPAWAQNNNRETQALRLAYVKTQQAEIDRLAEAGLRGLSAILRERTAVDITGPIGVDLARDELAFYPLLYWPFNGMGPKLSPAAAEKLAAYLAHGGLLVIDTRDGTGAAIAQNQLAEYFHAIALPALNPITSNHVLLRSFYLLQAWPGRFNDVTLWVADTQQNQFDGVASIIVGTQDWAGAWATDGRGKPLLPTSPGGEAQREMARRFGVNLVMYALTGNYKADQVHVPAILERLGNAP